MWLKSPKDREFMGFYKSREELHTDCIAVCRAFLKCVHVWMPLRTENFNTLKYLKIWNQNINGKKKGHGCNKRECFPGVKLDIYDAIQPKPTIRHRWEF